MPISDAQILATLGLSPDFDGAKIGSVNVLQAKGAMELIIDDHNETARENDGTIVLTFEEYRLALKKMEKLKRENAELEANEQILSNLKQNGIFEQYSEAVSRVAQTELYSGMDERWADRSGQMGEFVAAKVAGMSGASKMDKKTISDVKAAVGDPHKLEVDNKRKRLMQQFLYREAERHFANVYNPVVCTDDWEGYSTYLWHFVSPSYSGSSWNWLTNVA